MDELFRAVLEAVDTGTAPAADTETSIVAALRSRLIAKDTQIAQLKAALRQRVTRPLRSCTANSRN